MFGRRSFLSGMLTGGLIGAVIGMLARPQRAPERGYDDLLDEPAALARKAGRSITGILGRRNRC